MSRTVPPALLAALAQPTVRPFHAVECLFDSGPIRLWTGVGERTIAGEVYAGAGTLMMVGGLEETADVTPRQATITLSALPAEVLALALAEAFQRRLCRIRFGVVDVPDTVLVFEGLMNTMPIADGADTATIGLTIDSRLIELDQAPSHLRYTAESQRARYPGDTFFDFVADIQDRDFVLGRRR